MSIRTVQRTAMRCESRAPRLRVGHVIRSPAYRLIFESPTHDGAIEDGELDKAAARHDAPFRDVEDVQDADDVVVSGTRALDVMHQLGLQHVLHARPEHARVQSGGSLVLVKKEHFGRCVERVKRLE